MRVFLLVALCAGCTDEFAPHSGGDGDLGAGGEMSSSGSDGNAITTDAGAPDLAPEPSGPCDVTFRFVPPAGTTVGTVEARGEWNGFAAPGVALTPDGSGAFVGKQSLMPGLVGYKLIVDGNWQLDPGARWRKYVGGVENSGVRVENCHIPALALARKNVIRAAAGQGDFSATVAFRPSLEGAALDPSSVSVTLRAEDQSTAVAGVSADASAATISFDVGALADGKYQAIVAARDASGRSAHPLRLVFWIEAQPFDWRDAVVYMVMTDRFQDGDPSSNAAPTSGVDPRADFHGGDLQGITNAISDGTFDALGVNALWISPFHQNPTGAYKADDGVHDVMGYHGYWPVKARAVEPRIGGAAALTALVKAAHAHGIRVLQDYVINHVHQDHEYFQQHPEWFRTGCICGTNNCDWTTHRLDCLFAAYMPDVNWTVPEVAEQWSDDAVWWLDTFDLDGLRLDAVKHVEDVATINMSARIREELEAAGTRVLLTGETAMGWSDCGLQCNADQYGTISRYIGPTDLDGQADFVLYHAVPYRAFSSDGKGMIHVDYWSQQSQLQYPAGAIMTPYIGSHDTPRFVTLASYRGQDSAHDPSIPGNKWSNIAAAPPDGEPYARLRLALSWLLALPGAPLIYYGDEYGEWGGADPNNRVWWRGKQALSADEQATLARTRALGQARRSLVALRRGSYVPVASTEDWLVFARQSGSDVALVALTRAAAGANITAALPSALGLANGTVLHDRLGGGDVTIAQGSITLALPSRGAAILAP